MRTIDIVKSGYVLYIKVYGKILYGEFDCVDNCVVWDENVDDANFYPTELYAKEVARRILNTKELLVYDVCFVELQRNVYFKTK